MSKRAVNARSLSRVRAPLQAETSHWKLPFQLPFSGGVAQPQGLDNQEAFEALLSSADYALYRLKRYRDRVKEAGPREE